jgi:hypothetical protein
MRDPVMPSFAAWRREPVCHRLGAGDVGTFGHLPYEALDGCWLILDATAPGHGRHDGANRRVRLRSAAMGAAGTPNEVVSFNGSNARHTKVCDGMHAWLWRSNVR